MLVFNYGFWEFWELYNPNVTFGEQKVSFDGINKLILVNEPVTQITVLNDIYSNWKEWSMVRDNGKFLQALSAIGGDPITSTSAVGTTFFLENGWRIRPWNGDYILTINGNIFTREEGDDPFVQPTNKESAVTINLFRSNLVDTVTLGDVLQGTKVDELHKLAGLQTSSPLSVGSASRTAGDISQTITGTDPVIVTRDP